MESYEYRYYPIITDQATIDRAVEARANQMRKEYNRRKVYEWRVNNLEHFREYQRNKANEANRLKRLKKREELEKVGIIPEV